MTATVTPYLCVHDTRAALDFYREAFGAEVTSVIEMPDGRVGHAEFSIDGAGFMLADEFPEIGHVSPRSLGGSAVLLHLAIDDAEIGFEQVVAAGATVVDPVKDQGNGNRAGNVEDPFGHRWMLSSPLPPP